MMCARQAASSSHDGECVGIGGWIPVAAREDDVSVLVVENVRDCRRGIGCCGDCRAPVD